MKDTIMRIFFPKRCKLCGDIVPLGKKQCICETIIEPARVSRDFCESCGCDFERCSCTSNGTAVLPHIAAVFRYEGLIKKRLHAFKFHGDVNQSEYFSFEMSMRFVTAYPLVNIDFVCFVPMTQESEESRGYNQSRLLAQGVADKLFVECRPLLKKTAETKKQHTLSQSERLSNLENCFSLSENEDVKGKTILLIDDIKTTGTTLKKCCDVLLSAGAADVYCLCCAVSNYHLPSFILTKK